MSFFCGVAIICVDIPGIDASHFEEPVYRYLTLMMLLLQSLSELQLWTKDMG